MMGIDRAAPSTVMEYILMRSIYITNMARSVVEHLRLPPSALEQVKDAIQAEWMGAIAVVFTRHDVALVCEKNGWLKPTADEADEVLQYLSLNDEGRGVSLADIKQALQDFGYDEADPDPRTERRLNGRKARRGSKRQAAKTTPGRRTATRPEKSGRVE